MPNWCSNKLVLKGNIKYLEKFYNDNLSSEVQDGNLIKLSFNKSVTRPKSEESNWYKWNCENWGTKWDACYVSFKKEKKHSIQEIRNTLLVMNRKLENNVEPVIPIIQNLFTYYEYIYFLETAWGPPFKWLESISLKYKNIVFELEFSVEGFDNEGIMLFSNGELIKCEEWKFSDKVYKHHFEEIKSIIYNILIEEKLTNLETLNEINKKKIINSILKKCWEKNLCISSDNIESYFKN